MRFTRDDLVIGRVISEDNQYMLVEILKDDNATFTLDLSKENNQFYTLAFITVKDGEAKIWKPWV